MSLSASFNPDLLKSAVNRALRRDSVDMAVFTLKYVLIGVGVLILVFMIREIISSRMYVSSAISKFEQDVQRFVEGARAPATQGSKPDYTKISSRNIFGPLTAKGINTSTSPVVKPVTKLPLVLIGTFLATGEPPYAIIEDDKKKIQDVFNLNELVFGDAKLVGIYSDRVELNRNGEIEILRLDDAPDSKGGSSISTSSTGQDEFTVEEGELDKALENLPLLLTQARAVPYFKEGKSVGLRLFAIKTGSLFEKVGLMNGDILKSINGNSLADITQAMKLFEMLKQERNLSVTVERNREEREFKYTIR